MIRATIYDVAREAGVSIATVSHVMNGKGKISRERREEILDIMQRLNYRPNAIASALAGKNLYPGIARPRHLQPLLPRLHDRSRITGISLDTA